MKKLLFIFGIFLLLGCEVYDYGNFYVINNCIFSIDVEIVNYNHQKTQKTADPGSATLVYVSKGIGGMSDNLMETLFLSLIGIHEKDTTKVNFIDKNFWNIQVIDDNHANYYLEIDSVDFRQIFNGGKVVANLKLIDNYLLASQPGGLQIQYPWLHPW